MKVLMLATLVWPSAKPPIPMASALVLAKIRKMTHRPLRVRIWPARWAAPAMSSVV